MIVIVIIQSVILIGAAGYGAYWVYKRVMLSFDQEKSIIISDADKRVAQTELSVVKELQHTMLEYGEKAGRGEGHTEVVRALPQFLGGTLEQIMGSQASVVQQFLTMYMDGEKARAKLLYQGDINSLLETYQKKLSISSSNQAALANNTAVALEELKRLKEKFQVALDQIDEGTLLKPASEEVSTQPIPSVNIPQTQLNDPANPIVTELPGSFQGDLEGQVPKTLSLRPGFNYEYSRDSNEYIFRIGEFDGGDREIEVILRMGGQKVGSFWESQLVKGQATNFSGELPTNVVLCGLPTCQIVAFTQQPNTKCCCNAHTIELRKYNKIIKKAGS